MLWCLGEAEEGLLQAALPLGFVMVVKRQV